MDSKVSMCVYISRATLIVSCRRENYGFPAWDLGSEQRFNSQGRVNVDSREDSMFLRNRPHRYLLSLSTSPALVFQIAIVQSGANEI